MKDLMTKRAALGTILALIVLSFSWGYSRDAESGGSQGQHQHGLAGPNWKAFPKSGLRSPSRSSSTGPRTATSENRGDHEGQGIGEKLFNQNQGPDQADRRRSQMKGGVSPLPFFMISGGSSCNVQQLLEVEVGVLLRRGQTACQEVSWITLSVRATAEKMRGEGVAERMGADLPPDGRPPDVFPTILSTDREVSRSPL